MMLQSGVEVLVGPVPAEKAAQFAPGGSAAGALQRFVKQAAGADTEVNLQLQLTEAPPPCRLAREKRAILGWNTRLGGNASTDVGKIKLKSEAEYDADIRSSGWVEFEDTPAEEFTDRLTTRIAGGNPMT